MRILRNSISAIKTKSACLKKKSAEKIESKSACLKLEFGFRVTLGLLAKLFPRIGGIWQYAEMRHAFGHSTRLENHCERIEKRVYRDWQARFACF